MNSDRWQQLMDALGSPANGATFDELHAAYSERHRYYHTSVHIDDCLDKLDGVRTLAESPEEVELSLWFHDAIYRPMSSNNEQASAEWAVKFLQESGSNEDRCQRVYRHIMATVHDARGLNGDTALVVDIDLSILGADEVKYGEFESNVRKEYRWVPRSIYRRKRIEILQSFLDRSTVYATSSFIDRYEQQARMNLHSAIQVLRR